MKILKIGAVYLNQRGKFQLKYVFLLLLFAHLKLLMIIWSKQVVQIQLLRQFNPGVPKKFKILFLQEIFFDQ